MPSFPGDNLDPDRVHGDLLLLVQSDHVMVTHHAMRDVMRRTKGRLQGRWAQPCFQRFATAERDGKGPDVAAARGLLGFADGSQNIPTDADLRGERSALGARRKLRGRAPDPAEDRALGPPLAHGAGGLDRAAQARRRAARGRARAGHAEARARGPRSTPTSAWRTRAPARTDERRRFLRRAFVYNNGFDEYGLLDSGSVFLAFCRDVRRSSGRPSARTRGQDLDEYMVAVGGGYFFCPPGVARQG